MKKRSLKGFKTSLNVNQSVEGETIEDKCRRIENNKEPITDGAPIIWTPRDEGVKPEYNIRTDRFEIAIDAMDTAAKSNLAKRQQFYDEKKTKESPAGESIQGTTNQADK